MSSMYLALGYKCNHKCYFCPCGNNKIKAPVASVEELKKAIDNGLNNNVKYITLSGGEPTLHPYFHEILEYCVRSGLNVGILSNGETFFKQENTEKFFRNINPGKIHVTTAIHSINKEYHERVTGVSGSFERSINGLKNVINMGIPVTVKQVISKWNYRELPDFADFVYREYGSYVSLTLCGMDFCGMNPEQIEAVAVSYKEIGVYLEKALDNIISIRQQFGAFPYVSVADLPLCCADPYYWGFFQKVSRGNLSQYSAPSNEEGKVESTNNIINDCDVFFESCRNCCVSDKCPGVWKTAFDYFGESAVKNIYPYNE